MKEKKDTSSQKSIPIHLQIWHLKNPRAENHKGLGKQAYPTGR